MADAVYGADEQRPVDEHGHDAASHAAHEQMPYLQHHWETPAQQFDAGKLGMWLFLATEILFFAGLFCAYAVLRRNHPEVFLVGQHFLDVKWGAINTVVLILSSFTMALGVWCAQTSRKNGLIVCLILTLAGAFTFMAIKYVEYSHKIHEGIVWGHNFNPQRHNGHGSHASPTAASADPTHVVAGGGAADHAAAAAPSGDAADESAQPPPAPDHSPAPSAAPTAAAATSTAQLALEVSQVGLAPPGPSGLAPAAVLEPAAADHAHGVDPYEAAGRMRDLHLFMSVYFALTGLHGIHVLAGIVAISLVLWQAIKGKYNSDYYTHVDLVGLYWHVVDLVWIFLFPLLYLIH